jgi:hypothetical protein
LGPPNDTADLARVGALGKEAQTAKERGLYADEHDGAVRSPTDVSKHEARKMINEVKEVLEIGGALINESTVMWAKSDQPDETRSALAHAAQAVMAGTAAVEEFIRSPGFADIKRRVEIVQSDPEFLGRISEHGWLERVLRAGALDAPANDD